MKDDQQGNKQRRVGLRPSRFAAAEALGGINKAQRSG
jgi:hypothetical protein